MITKPGETPFLSAAEPLLRFYGRALALKRLYRQGWLMRGVSAEQCESVADHSFLTALLAWRIAAAERPDLNPERVLMLALVHELGEIGAGDITPHDGIGADEKRRREEEAVVALCADLPGGDELIALWREFEYGGSPEADFVRQMDKLEMALQALAYEQSTGLDLPGFVVNTAAMLCAEPLPRLLKAARRADDE